MISIWEKIHKSHANYLDNPTELILSILRRLLDILMKINSRPHFIPKILFVIITELISNCYTVIVLLLLSVVTCNIIFLTHTTITNSKCSSNISMK